MPLALAKTLPSPEQLTCASAATSWIAERACARVLHQAAALTAPSCSLEVQVEELFRVHA